MMMDKLRGITIILLLFIFITLSRVVVADADGKVEEKASAASQKLKETMELLKDSSFRSWDKVRSIVGQLQTQFFPPNLEIGEKNSINEAAEKTLEESKAAIEGSAKSAADAVERAAHVTKDKVIEKVPRVDESKSEL